MKLTISFILSGNLSDFTVGGLFLVVVNLKMSPVIVFSEVDFINITKELGILLNTLVEELEDFVKGEYLREVLNDRVRANVSYIFAMSIVVPLVIIYLLCSL
jgi:hypothetical protein